VIQQCYLVTEKISHTPRSIRRSIVKVEGDDPSLLLRTVRPHLKPCLGCCVQCWVSQYERDMGILERVQQKATKLVRDLEHIP